MWRAASAATRGEFLAFALQIASTTCAVSEALAIAARHDPRSLRAERGGSTVTRAVHARLDLLARPCAREAALQRIGLLRIAVLDPPLDARAGIATPLPPVTKEEWDDLNEIPGLSEDGD